MTPLSKVLTLDHLTRVCLTSRTSQTEEYRRSIEVDGELTWVRVVYHLLYSWRLATFSLYIAVEFEFCDRHISILTKVSGYS